MTRTWAIQDVKARLSEVIRAAEKEPQRITYRGEEKAVLLSSEDYRKLCGESGAERPKSLWEVLRAAPKVPELKIERVRGKIRPVDL